MHCFFQREALKHEVPRPSFIYPGRHEACGKHKGVDGVLVMVVIAPWLNYALIYGLYNLIRQYKLPTSTWVDFLMFQVG